MEKAHFLRLSDNEMAAKLGASGLVAAMPINGTRRWFMLEHMPPPDGTEMMMHYMATAGNAHVRIFKLAFDHGITTLLSPTFGPDIMQRDEAYIRMAVEGMRHLVKHPKFLDFYAEYEVRVRFYGEYRKYFAGTTFEPLCDLFDELTEKTCQYNKHRLFWGICAHDTVQPIADLSVAFYQAHGHTPTREDLVKAYYGEAVPPVDFFIGFDRFAAYDMPLLTTGEEDLYFTIAPTLYITKEQFREILYDHLYTRHQSDTNYGELDAADWQQMKAFYHANIGSTQGIGERHPQGDYWHPIPQVKQPQRSEEIE